jgi:hypothetical protein
MKRIPLFTIIFIIFFPLSGNIFAQPGIQTGLNEKEPLKRHIGAPFYPGAVYIRTTTGLDPYYETAEYITADNISAATVFFEEKLSEKHEITYEDKDNYMVIFLLKTWSSFPDKPPKEALEQLDHEPNVQLREFHEDRYTPLIQHFERKPDGKRKAAALREGHTLILYTYRISEVDRSADMLIGAWMESDRDLQKYWGSILEFMPNGTYKFTFTEPNLKYMAQKYAGTGPFKDMESSEVLKILFKKNPETGTYAITKNVISLKSPDPVDGQFMKNGLAGISSASLVLELVNNPKMVFVKLHKNKVEPRKRMK